MDTPIRIHTFELNSTGTLDLAVAVESGLECLLEESENLHTWQAVSTNLAEKARLELSVPNRPSVSPRFYCVRRFE